MEYFPESIVYSEPAVSYFVQPTEVSRHPNSQVFEPSPGYATPNPYVGGSSGPGGGQASFSLGFGASSFSGDPSAVDQEALTNWMWQQMENLQRKMQLAEQMSDQISIGMAANWASLQSIKARHCGQAELLEVRGCTGKSPVLPQHTVSEVSGIEPKDSSLKPCASCVIQIEIDEPVPLDAEQSYNSQCIQTIYSSEAYGQDFDVPAPVPESSPHGFLSGLNFEFSAAPISVPVATLGEPSSVSSVEADAPVPAVPDIVEPMEVDQLEEECPRGVTLFSGQCTEEESLPDLEVPILEKPEEPLDMIEDPLAAFTCTETLPLAVAASAVVFRSAGASRLEPGGGAAELGSQISDLENFSFDCAFTTRCAISLFQASDSFSRFSGHIFEDAILKASAFATSVVFAFAMVLVQSPIPLMIPWLSSTITLVRLSLCLKKIKDG